MTTPYQAATGIVATDAAAAIDLDKDLGDSIDTLVDGINGYSTAADKMDDVATQRMFNELAASRRQVTEQLVRIAAEAGFEVNSDIDGTATGALHRAWIAVEGTISGDSALVESALTGESHAAEVIGNAVTLPYPAPVAGALRDALTDIEAATRRLEATVPS